MRFVTNIPHPNCRISVHNMNNKFIIKFENRNLEQVYKFDETELSSAEEITTLLTDDFLQRVMHRFTVMNEDFTTLLEK